MSSNPTESLTQDVSVLLDDSLHYSDRAEAARRLVNHANEPRVSEAMYQVLTATPASLRTSELLAAVLDGLSAAANRTHISALLAFRQQVRHLVDGARSEGAPRGALALVEPLDQKAAQAIRRIEAQNSPWWKFWA